MIIFKSLRDYDDNLLRDVPHVTNFKQTEIIKEHLVLLIQMHGISFPINQEHVLISISLRRHFTKKFN